MQYEGILITLLLSLMFLIVFNLSLPAPSKSSTNGICVVKLLKTLSCTTASSCAMLMLNARIVMLLVRHGCTEIVNALLIRLLVKLAFCAECSNFFEAKSAPFLLIFKVAHSYIFTQLFNLSKLY